MTAEKEIKIFRILLVTLLGVGIFAILFKPKHETYAQTTVVSEVNYKTNEITCVDFNGNEWVFEDCEDWLVGDYCSMVMCDNGTEEIFDDKIISVKYSGWLEGGFGLTDEDEFVIEN